MNENALANAFSNESLSPAKAGMVSGSRQENARANSGSPCDRVLAETDGTGPAGTKREYIWLSDMPVAVIDKSVTPNKTYMVHADHLNRPYFMTDAARAIVWKAIYEPFGAVYSTTGTAAQTYRFPGQWFQIETGLAYNWHRHYDPSLGRYVSADPLGLYDGPSVYGYVGQKPTIRSDNTGLYASSAQPNSSLADPSRVCSAETSKSLTEKEVE